MESDSFFWQLLARLPETLFALVGLPPSIAADYRFESVEVKKSYRLDGLFTPSKAKLPIYIVEVQFQRNRRFYANLFAKVFSYLEANDPNQDWRALALFETRKVEPKAQPGYQVLVDSHHVHRIYLDEIPDSGDATPGIKILRLVTAPREATRELVSDLVEQSRQDADCERGQAIVQLVEELLMRRFTEFDREEIRRMFQLHDLKESKVWQEAEQLGKERGLQEGREEGREEGLELANRAHVKRLLAKGSSHKEIAELLAIPIADVRRLARSK